VRGWVGSAVTLCYLAEATKMIFRLIGGADPYFRIVPEVALSLTPASGPAPLGHDDQRCGELRGG